MDDENGEEEMEFGGEKRSSRIFCWMKMNRFDTHVNMERSKKLDIGERCRKWPKIFFENFWVEIGNLSKLANWIKNHCFLCGFLQLMVKNKLYKLRKKYVSMRPVNGFI